MTAEPRDGNRASKPFWVAKPPETAEKVAQIAGEARFPARFSGPGRGGARRMIERMGRRGRLAADFQLLIASGLTGVAGASFILISERAVGLDAIAPVAQLWTIWSISAATLLFAYQQWAIRLGVGRRIGLLRALRGAPARLLVAATLGTGLVTLAVRSSLFHSASLFWPAAAGVVVLGTAVGGVVRGQLAATGRHSLLALVIAGDNMVRMVLAVVLVAAGATVGWFALAHLASYLVLAVGWLPDRRPAGGGGGAAGAGDGATGHCHQDGAAGGPGSGGEVSPGTATLGTAAAAGFLSHVALAGPPLLVAVNGGSARTVSTLFVVLTAIRLPHLMLQAGAPRAGVAFHGWVEAGRHDRLDRARLAILAGTSAVAAVAFGTGALLGDLVIGTLFDIRGRVDPVTYGLFAAAGVCSVGDAFATVLLVARGANRFLVTRWLALLTVALGAGLATGLTGLRATATGLLALHAAMLVALTAQSPDPATGGRPRSRSWAPTRPEPAAPSTP